jgi:hypothetical protein
MFEFMTEYMTGLPYLIPVTQVLSFVFLLQALPVMYRLLKRKVVIVSAVPYIYEPEGNRFLLFLTKEDIEYASRVKHLYGVGLCKEKDAEPFQIRWSYYTSLKILEITGHKSDNEDPFSDVEVIFRVIFQDTCLDLDNKHPDEKRIVKYHIKRGDIPL